MHPYLPILWSEISPLLTSALGSARARCFGRSIRRASWAAARSTRNGQCVHPASHPRQENRAVLAESAHEIARAHRIVQHEKRSLDASIRLQRRHDPHQLVASHSDQRDIVLGFGDKSLGSIDQGGRSTPAHKAFEHQSAAADVRVRLRSSGTPCGSMSVSRSAIAMSKIRSQSAVSMSHTRRCGGGF
jgi:hypothetical protein